MKGQMRDRQITAIKLLLLQSLHRKQRQSLGFTLGELLVAMIVGSILTLLLLSLVVQLMGTNQREASRSDTQREMQAALDYINRDLREAVYVYDGKCMSATADAERQCPGILTKLPTQLNAGDNLPVLAFWRLDPLPESLLIACRNNATQLTNTVNNDTPPGLESAPCTGKKMYTLVVYSLNKGTGPWRGRARITRYTLPQYSFTSAAALSQVPGWYSPLTYGFDRWPTAPDDKTPLPTVSASNIAGNNQVLVDFVDDVPHDGRAAGSAAPCPGDATAPIFTATPAQTGGGYTATPANLSRRTFYACVRGAGASSLNQEVVVRLIGNAAGRPGIPLTLGKNVPITMETRVLTRGVLNKN
jgi:type II secretory pathway pseudopilin PulG